jgi:diguanylate cyclase (GGDEF)-like protein
MREPHTDPNKISPELLRRTPLRILLVDDDAEEYLLTRDMLADHSYSSGRTEQARFDLEWVGTYEAGLEAFEKDQHDIYLIDYHLGGRDGLELMREVIARGCKKPIIVMTGRGNYELDVEAMRAGATDYLVKGEVTPPLLERTLRYAIERKRAEEVIRWNAERAQSLANISQAFAEASLNYQAIMETITRHIFETLGDACILRLAFETGESLAPVAFSPTVAAGPKELKPGRGLEELGADERLSWQVFETGKPVSLFETVPQEKNQPDVALGEGKSSIQSLLIVPLQVHGKLIGTISAMRFERGKPYSQADLVYLQDVAGRAALAIENARLYRAEAQRAIELDALHQATIALLSTIDLETLLNQILDAAQSAIPAAEKGVLHFIPPDTGELQLRAMVGYTNPRIERTVILKKGGYLAQAVLDRKPVLIRDLQQMGDALQDFREGGDSSIRSAIVAPLMLEATNYGALSLISSQPDAFKDADLRLLISFAATTTAALQNAMLHSEVQKTAITDALTDLYNRRGILELGRREVERARRFGRPLTLMFVDLDKFKEINDNFGHLAGDEVLQIISERLRFSTRDVDILGRYGGDEFIILLPETDLFMACAVAERIRLRIAEPFFLAKSAHAGKTMGITASLGVANLLSETPDLLSLVERADSASYQAKRSGRNRIQVG